MNGHLDRETRRLIAARDRFGIKPLFYAWHRDTLYLASEVKALFAAGVPARWDEESVYNSVTFGKYQTRTLYDRVYELPGATEHAGFGIKNLRKRLNLLYGDNFELNITTEHNVFTAFLKVPLA